MRAVSPGPPEALQIRDLPIPHPSPDGYSSASRPSAIDRTYTLDEIAIAHADMEAGNAVGKLVVLPSVAGARGSEVIRARDRRHPNPALGCRVASIRSRPCRRSRGRIENGPETTRAVHASHPSLARRRTLV